MRVKIIKAENGWITIVGSCREERRIHDTLEDAIQSIGRDALLHFEGKGSTFTGDSYGKVSVTIETNSPK